MTELDLDQIQNRKAAQPLSMFPWAVEVVAVIISLSIGLSMVFEGVAQRAAAVGEESLDTAGILNITISAFLMVAVVELTKIPMLPRLTTGLRRSVGKCFFW